jgi:hypothetical protein
MEITKMNVSRVVLEYVGEGRFRTIYFETDGDKEGVCDIVEAPASQWKKLMTCGAQYRRRDNVPIQARWPVDFGKSRNFEVRLCKAIMQRWDEAEIEQELG